MTALAALFIVLLASAGCPYGTRGRLPYVIAKAGVLAVLGAILGAVEALRAAG